MNAFVILTPGEREVWCEIGGTYLNAIKERYDGGVFEASTWPGSKNVSQKIKISRLCMATPGLRFPS